MDNSVRHIRWLACATLIMLWFAVACAKAPHEGQQAAEKAVQQARNAGAPTYLPDDFNALEAKLESAKEEISAQYKLSEFRRDYSRANSLLAETQAEGGRIIAEAQKRREDAKAVALQEREQAKRRFTKCASWSSGLRRRRTVLWGKFRMNSRPKPAT